METTLFGQTAIDLIKYRIPKNPRDAYFKPYGSIDSNFAAVTLVFKDNRYTTAWAESGGGYSYTPPFHHFEARALGECILKSIKNNMGILRKRMVK